MTLSSKQRELLAYEAYAKARREAREAYGDALELVHAPPKRRRDPRLPVQTKVVALPGPEASVGAFSLYQQSQKPRKKARGPDAVDDWFAFRAKR